MTIYGLCKQIKINQMKLVALNPVNALNALLIAGIKVTRSKITPLF